MAQKAKKRAPVRPSRRARGARSQSKATVGRPRTRADFYKLSEAAQDKYTDALHAVAKMRSSRNLSLRQAARAAGIDAKVVTRLVGPALHKDKRGRWTATTRDRLLRVLNIPSARGTRDIAVTDSRTASHIGSYMDAIRKFIDTGGDPSVLKPFRKLRLLDANGRRISLLTNRRALERLGQAGMLSFETMYVRTV